MTTDNYGKYIDGWECVYNIIFPTYDELEADILYS